MNHLNRRPQYQYGSLLREDRKRGPAVWVYRYSNMGQDGRKKRRKVIVGDINQFPTKSLAERACEPLRTEANQELLTEKPVTMRTLLDRYETEVLPPPIPVGGTMSPDQMSDQCARSYRSNIRKYIRPTWTDVLDRQTGKNRDYLVADFSDVRLSAEIERWLRSLLKSEKNPKGLEKKTVHHLFTTMKAIFKHAVKWGYLERSPMGNRDLELVELPRGSTRRSKKPFSLTPGGFFALLAVLGVMEKAAVSFAGWLGPRISEAFGLRWSDLDFERKVVTFERGFVNGRISALKTEASRTSIPLPSEVIEALQAWREVTPYNTDADWVFASPHSHGRLPYYPGQFLKDRIKPVAKELGLGDIGWHTFRHSVSSWGKESLKLGQTKELLRHANLATTSELYGDLNLDAKREAQGQLVAHIKASAALADARSQQAGLHRIQ